MKKINKSKVIIPALAMIALTTAASATGTVAWFSLNTTVAATGMQVTVKTASNLLISETATPDSSYTTAITQTRNGILEPASTINGTNFYYTVDAKADGSKNQNTTASPYVAYSENAAPAIVGTNSGKTTYDADFNTAYNIGTVSASNVAYAYIDYTFYLKATASSAEGQKVAMTTLDLKYNGGAVSEKAWRVAVFAEENTDPSAFTGTLAPKTILKATDAAYFGDTAVKDEDEKAAVDSNLLGKPAIVDDTIDAKSTTYYQVVVRLWLEGEDTTCNTATFANLTAAYTLDVNFSIGAGITPVAVIG